MPEEVMKKETVTERSRRGTAVLLSFHTDAAEHVV